MVKPTIIKEVVYNNENTVNTLLCKSLWNTFCFHVVIAAKIVNNPDIILADEPTGALDSKTSIQIMDLLKEIAKEYLNINNAVISVLKPKSL